MKKLIQGTVLVGVCVFAAGSYAEACPNPNGLQACHNQVEAEFQKCLADTPRQQQDACVKKRDADLGECNRKCR